jgi:hypothetical protein
MKNVPRADKVADTTTVPTDLPVSSYHHSSQSNHMLRCAPESPKHRVPVGQIGYPRPWFRLCPFGSCFHPPTASTQPRPCFLKGCGHASRAGNWEAKHGVHAVSTAMNTETDGVVRAVRISRTRHPATALFCWHWHSAMQQPFSALEMEGTMMG